MSVIHFTEKFKEAMVDYFATGSVTENLYNHKIDTEFVGNDTVHITEIATTPIGNYDKSVDPSKGSRFGNVEEVGDYQYTFKMTQDISLDRTVDRGNNDSQFNMKKAGQIMKAYTDQRIRPLKDTYRFKQWFENAGIHKPLTGAPTEKTICKDIIELHSEQIDNDVPMDGGYLIIPRKWVPTLQLADQWVGLDSLGGKTLPKGVTGEFDGLMVKPVPTRRVPDHAYFAIQYPESAISPEKINTFRGIKDSENMDGDRIQYRSKFDAFVMPNKCMGIAVACEPATVQEAPKISLSGHSATVTASGATIYYTLDGSDPRYPGAEVKVYADPVSTVNGQTIRACAKKSGKWTSAVVEATDNT